MLYNRSYHDMTLSNFASKDPLIDKSPIYNIYIDLHKNNNIRFYHLANSDIIIKIYQHN
jgi:hypothetical protein